MANINDANNTNNNEEGAVNLPQEVIDFLNAVNTPGAFQKAQVVATPKPKAASKGVKLEKVTEGVIRTGIDYANLKENDGIETGDLPWGEWIIKPYLIQHKGEWYGRLYYKKDTVKVVSYKVDGVEVTKAVFSSHLTASAAAPKPPTKGNTLTITPKISAITLI